MVSSPRQLKKNRTINLIAFLALVGVLFISLNLRSELLIEENNSTAIQQTQLQSTRKTPEVLVSDVIYKHARTVFVIPEYKHIFFTFPKVASSEWKRMFMRMNGNPNWCKIRGFDAHNPKNNKISTLSDYPTEIATAMMTSPSWTRAAIVREPKERVLSAFLDKAVKEDYYVRKCCESIPDEEDKEECKKNEKDFKSFLHFLKKYPKKCFDVHWCVYEIIYLFFIIYFNSFYQSF